MKYWYLKLGDGYDCEYCGWNYDEINVTFNDDGWEGRVDAGCYSGASAYTKDEIIEMILSYAESGWVDRNSVYNLAGDVFLEQNYYQYNNELSDLLDQ